ncbi:MAG: DUF1697 domain-containing protein [Actinobacteria bacterium]|nr:DUF1697 domain-containing protein [Actinomycetota bacterium]MCG2798201.1 DUF1697 domain-containing protein [Cellulomonas sp.]
MTVVVALARAVNVGGRPLRSADLREVATSLGCRAVATYLASGNLVAVTDLEPEALAGALGNALGERAGFEVPVIVRDLAAWDAAVDGLSYPRQAREAPSRVALVAFDGPVRAGAQVDPARTDREQVTWSGSHAYVWYPDGQGRSRLTLDVLSKAAGRTGTARNWSTVLALAALGHERADR